MATKPIADWLRAARLRRVMDNGEPWTQDHVLDLMARTIGWAPARPNYSKYETGRATPKSATLAKLVEFWALQGEPGPDLLVPEPVPPIDLATAISRQADAIMELVVRLDRLAVGQVESTDGILRAIAAAVGAPAPARMSSGSGHEALAGTGR